MIFYLMHIIFVSVWKNYASWKEKEQIIFRGVLLSNLHHIVVIPMVFYALMTACEEGPFATEDGERYMK